MTYTIGERTYYVSDTGCPWFDALNMVTWIASSALSDAMLAARRDTKEKDDE